MSDEEKNILETHRAKLIKSGKESLEGEINVTDDVLKARERPNLRNFPTPPT